MFNRKFPPSFLQKTCDTIVLILIGNDHLEILACLRSQRMEQALEIIASIERGDNEGEFHEL